MKRKFQIGPFLPTAVIAAVLCVCLVFVSLPAMAESQPDTALTQSESQTGMKEESASSADTPTLRKLRVEYEQTPSRKKAMQPEAKPQKPEPQEHTQSVSEAAPQKQEPENLVLLDTFLATAYCVTGTTSTGTYTTENRTLAVNPNVIPYGTHVWMYLDDGTLVGDFYAEDTGSNMMENPYVVDIYMGEDSYDECILWGVQHVSIYVEADAV